MDGGWWLILLLILATNNKRMGTTVTYYKGWVVGWFTNWIALTLWLMMTDLIYWLTDWLIGWWWGDVPMTGGKESPGERGPPFIEKWGTFAGGDLIWGIFAGVNLRTAQPHAGCAWIELILLVVKIWVAQHLCGSCVNWADFAGGEDLGCTAFMQVVHKLSCVCWGWRCSVCMCIYM